MSVLTVAYQGEPGAFSEQAAKSFFGRTARLVPQLTFKDVFRYAASNRSHFGIVPIENSVFGSVHQIYDLLLRHRLSIIGEVKLRIRLHLLAMPNVCLSEIRSVYSHPQALGQCEDFLRTLRRVAAVAYYDTAGAAKMLKGEGRFDAGAIASEQAARTYGLRIVRRNVESNHNNFTRFIILSSKPGAPKGAMKTSLVFSVKDIPGALFKALAVFALREINLHKIESRPLVGRPWEYLFYVDLEGSPGDLQLIQALDHLKQLTTMVRLLGSYPPGKTIRG